MNTKFLKNNLHFIIICLSVVVLGIIVGIAIDTDTNKKLTIKENEPDGESKINKLIINEIMSSNKGTYADVDGNQYDWVELYNGNNYDINLKNYGLSDDKSKIKWVFPETIIKSKEYLIINLCGEKKEGLYANFRLSSKGGETLVLTKANGKVIDAITVTPLDKNETIARDLNGNLYTSDLPTPGFPNTKQGYENYINSLKNEENKIKINEILPRNKGNFINENGKLEGYIEIINISKNTVNLKTYSLSNSTKHPFTYKLPDISLKSGEVYVFYTATSSVSNNYTGFKLTEKTGEVVLSNGNKIVDIVEYDQVANGMALIYENEEYYISNNITPGYPNNNSGIKNFNEKNLTNPNDLIISEVMNQNNEYLPQNGGNYYDWIELKNNTQKTINLKDYYLTTNDNLKTMYNLPDVSLKPGGYYVVMASGDTNLSNNTYKHTNFKLSEIESLYLTKDNKIIDSIFIANVPLGYSMGRGTKSGIYYFSNPTPKSQNKNGTNQIAYTPIINVAPGIYNDVQNISIEIKGNGTIYYTLDGSIPNRSSKKYKSPIFLNKTSVLKVVSYEDDKLPSKVVTSSYIINENHTLPVLSLSLKQSDFNTIQSNTYSGEVERTAYAELFEENSSFSIPCGLKLFGGTTRGLPKKSFQLKFRSEYGASKLNYQVFNNRDFSSFDTLVLRSASTDYEYAAFADIFMTSTLEELETVEVQAYKTIILYINGTYWGIYNIREKIESEFIANHYNVSEDKVNITRIDNNVTCGSTTWYKEIVNYLSNHNMADQKNYEYIKTKIDIDSIIDFWIAETYTTNNDIVNARFYSHPDINDGKMRAIFYDLDWAMFNVTKNYYIFSTSATPMSRLQIPTTVLRNLMKNNEFKKRYVERLSYNLNNIWTYEKLSKKLEELYQIYKKEMPRNCERWNITMENWEDNVNRLRNYIKKRTPIMLNQTKSFFGLSESEMKKYFGDLLWNIDTR